MSRYAILLLRKNQSGIKQIHIGSALVLSLFCLVVIGLAAMSFLFYRQEQTMKSQLQIILEQETVQADLQRRIDMFDGREARIDFLEDYVEELKQNAYNSDITLKKNLALLESSLSRFSRLHESMCGILDVQCGRKVFNSEDSRETLAWLEQVQNDLEMMDSSIREFALNRKSYEVQATRIEELESQVREMEQNLVEHVEFIKVNQNTVDRLNKQISQSTGIALDRKSAQTKAVKSKKGRGGPSALDSWTLENPQALTQPGMLRTFLYIQSTDLDEAVASLEELSISVQKNHSIWRQTPTLIPTRSRLLSDRYGKRRDPFTRKKEYHAGLDFVARPGSPVFAPADGVVLHAKKYMGFGNLVVLRHGRGFYPGQRKTVRYRTRYAHLSKILVKKRQRVNRGDIIGLVGSTGRSTGPHLHYEILMNNRRTDPLLTISRFNSERKLYVR